VKDPKGKEEEDTCGTGYLMVKPETLQVTDSMHGPNSLLDLSHAETTSNVTTSDTSSSNPAVALSFNFIHRHTQKATIPYRSQQLLPFLSVVYSFTPPNSTN
jgi:hypothetical protein